MIQKKRQKLLYVTTSHQHCNVANYCWMCSFSLIGQRWWKCRSDFVSICAYVGDCKKNWSIVVFNSTGVVKGAPKWWWLLLSTIIVITVVVVRWEEFSYETCTTWLASLLPCHSHPSKEMWRDLPLQCRWSQVTHSNGNTVATCHKLVQNERVLA